MKKILFCLLSGAVLAFSSCQSEEPTTNSQSGTTTGGKAVNFTVGGTSPAVRTYYGANGSVNWSNCDTVYVFSYHTDAQEDAYQRAYYTIGESTGNSGSFEFAQHENFAHPIYWYDNDAMEQHFLAYYPAASVGADPANGRGAILFDTYSGEAHLHVPVDQSAMARVVPSAPEHDTHPLAYAIASTKSVTIDEESTVDLEFHDVMNVLRVHINNPSDQVVKGVKVSMTENSKALIYLSGTAVVSPPNHFNSFGEPAGYDDLTFWVNDLASVTPPEREVFAIEEEPSDLLNLYYDLYLLPQDYNGADIQVTVMMGDDDIADNDITKVIPSTFYQSSMKSVRINVPKPESVYMGVIDGKDFYMATGNLIAVYPSFYRPAEAAPEYYYIAGPVSGGSLYTADDVYYGISEMVSVERDMFKSGQFVDYTYWTYDSSQPSINLNPGTDFAGNGNYDLARLGLGAPWRLPTLSEIEMLTRQYYIQYVWEWKTNYKGIQGLNGMTISNIPGTTDGISSTDPVTTVFLPAQGHWGFVHGGGLFSNDSRHAYWGGTHGNNGIYRTMSFDETSFYSEVINTIGAAIRPVYTHGEEEPQRTPVDFVGESGGGWLITKPQDPSGSDQEETL